MAVKRARRGTRKKNCRTETERDCNQQRNHRGYERAVDKRQRAKLFGVRIPNARNEKFESELVTGQARIMPELKHKQQGDEHYGRGKKKRDDARYLVAIAKAGNKRARTR